MLINNKNIVLGIFLAMNLLETGKIECAAALNILDDELDVAVTPPPGLSSLAQINTEPVPPVPLLSVAETNAPMPETLSIIRAKRPREELESDADRTRSQVLRYKINASVETEGVQKALAKLGKSSNSNNPNDAPTKVPLKRTRDLDLQLIKATEDNDKDKVNALIMAGANINAFDKLGRTALIWSAINGHKEITELLINAGANVNSSSKYGSPVLIWAAGSGNKEIVELLINTGAEINASNEAGRTPLSIAADKGYKEIVGMLVKAGANIEHRDKQDKTAMDDAQEINDWDTDQAKINKPEIVKMLEGEPKRRENVVKKWIANNIGKFSETIGLMPDLSKLVGEYAIEYNSLPLDYRLAS